MEGLKSPEIFPSPDHESWNDRLHLYDVHILS